MRISSRVEAIQKRSLKEGCRIRRSSQVFCTSARPGPCKKLERFQLQSATRPWSFDVPHSWRRWTANLRILEVDEIKTVPHVPLSHPFVERLVGTVRREFLDHMLFWNARDLERKLAEFQLYYTAARSHASLDGRAPLTF